MRHATLEQVAKAPGRRRSGGTATSATDTILERRPALTMGRGLRVWTPPSFNKPDSYQAAEGEPVCEGVGHLRRRNEKKSDKGKGKGQGKSAPKGGGKKGKKSEKGFAAKGKTHAMLDFNETHGTKVE